MKVGWYEAQKELIQGIMLLIPVMGIIAAVWYYRSFPAEYDKVVVGGRTQTVAGRIIQIETDTHFVQRRWRENLDIRYKVHYRFRANDSTYDGIQILAKNWKNQHWIQAQTINEEIPVEYKVANPRINRMITEKEIR